MSSNSQDDPRDSSLETKFIFPNTWHREAQDPFGASGMLVSGLIMVTRNRWLAWPALGLAIVTYFNQHPLRSKEGGAGLSNLALSSMALLAAYIPAFIITNQNSKTTPLT